MTTQRQKNAVKFCEAWLQIDFEGDINNFNEVNTFLKDNLDYAKEVATELSCEYEAYINK